MNKLKVYGFGLIIGLVLALQSVAAQTNEFTYQGRLLDNTLPPTAAYDFEFKLYDALANGTQLGATQQLLGVQVTNGIFTVKLNFGAQFPGAARFIEISVKNMAGPFTVLAPRQSISSTPYAVKSVNADSATNATQLGGVPASQYVVTTDPRLTDDRPPTAGSSNYIQNQNAAPQSSSSFNISGSGTAGGTLSGNVLNSGTQLNINGLRSFTINGPFSGSTFRLATNTFLGEAAGVSTTPDPSVSVDAGKRNTFLGSYSGSANTTGAYNTFVGAEAGRSNTSASRNTYFGTFAGLTNTSGVSNAYFGYNAGIVSTGSSNTFVGRSPGEDNTTGSDNTFVGNFAGALNSTGSNNTAVGSSADIGSNNLNYATAIGAQSVATLSNSVYLGRPGGEDTVRIPGNLNVTNNTSLNGNLTFASGGIASINGPNIFMPSLNAGVGTTLCLTGNRVVTCSSSLRYKTNINRFGFGLDLIYRLKPITFDWKEGGMRDLGLGAEDVAAIEPLLVTYNDKGEVEGVKYDRIGVVLVNAVKEQQAQIEEQRKLIETQQRQIDAMKKLTCLTNKDADFCKE